MAEKTAVHPPLTAKRTGDLLSPILIREIQQVVKSKVFIITIWLALLAILLSALLFAAQSTTQYSSFNGFVAFQMTLFAFAPVLFFIVPFSAFLSMRQEVASGTSELLFLSRLKPRQIVLGKLQSACVQMLIYFSIFAPLIAVTFFLRGLTVIDISVIFLIGFELSLLSVSFALMLGAFCRYRIVSAFLLAFAGLGFASENLSIWGFLLQAYELSWFMRIAVFNWQFHLIFSGICLFGTVLFSQCASALIAHPFENRSTALRMLAAYGVVLAFTLTAFIVPQSDMADAGLGVCMGAMVCLTPFFLFSTSEASGFTPRTRLHVPRSRCILWLSMPFLPGGARGAIFSLLLIAFSSAAAFVLVKLSNRTSFGVSFDEMIWVTSAFVNWAVVFTLGSFVFRCFLPKQAKYSWIVRIVWPLSFGVLHFLMIIALVFINDGLSDEDVQQFYSIFGGIFAVILLCFSIPGIVLNISDALTVSKENRLRKRKSKAMEAHHAG